MKLAYHITAERMKKEKKSAGKTDLERSGVFLNIIFGRKSKHRFFEIINLFPSLKPKNFFNAKKV